MMLWRRRCGASSTRRYRARLTLRLEMRPELGIIEEHGARQRIVPDIAVVRHPHPVHEQTHAVPAALILAAVRRLEVHRIRAFHRSVRHHFVEIRDSSQGHKLITLIES